MEDGEVARGVATAIFFSTNVTSRHARERYAKTIEWRRYSGQMRLPSAMRLIGILKMSEDAERMACMERQNSVALFALKFMSVGPTCRKR